MNYHIIAFTILIITTIRVVSQNQGLLPKECGKPLPYSPFFGAPTTPANAYPWIAALFYEGSDGPQYTCAGTLINSKYVLTAASCLDSKYTNKLSFIRLGEWDLSTEEDCVGSQCLPRPIVASPEEIIIHPMFNEGTRYANDIALIRLSISVDFSTIKYGLTPICLPPNEFVFKYAAYDKRSFAAGWGTDKIVRSVALPVADDQLCRDAYKLISNFSDVTQLCVGGDGSDTCHGDGGGPLLLPGPYDTSYIQVGIVSYGKTPCGVNPSVYTSVVAYKNWIVQNLKP